MLGEDGVFLIMVFKIEYDVDDLGQRFLDKIIGNDFVDVDKFV